MKRGHFVLHALLACFAVPDCLTLLLTEAAASIAEKEAAER